MEFCKFIPTMNLQLRTYLEQFVTMTEEDYSLFRKLLEVRVLKKKEFLISAGEIENYIYYLDEGLIHRYFCKGKTIITTDLLSEGMVANAAVSFISGRPSNYYLQAMEPCRLLALSKNNLEILYRSGTKWQRMGRLFFTHYLVRQEKEMLDNIRLSMRERFLKFAANHPELMKRAPQHRLASFLNIKPETFTRLKPLLQSMPVNE
jgi:CRP-like cAMP-binding protein